MNMRSFILGAVAMLVLLIAAALIVILTGGYNVAATDRHAPTVTWALDTTFRNSVQRQAAGIRAPELTPVMIAEGASHYKAMCAHCHGGIGEGRAEWSEGMQPKPPALVRLAEEWSTSEVFWLVKHGAKATGMPSFGGTHGDEELWGIAAFVKAMPTMSAQKYAAFPSDHHEEGDGGHAHAAETPPHAH